MRENLIDAAKQLFHEGSRFRHVNHGLRSNKIGTVRNLRNDSLEKMSRTTNPNHYYYHVDFDDGTFETYLGQMWTSSDLTPVP